MCLDEGRHRDDSVRRDDDRWPFPRNDCSGLLWESVADADRKIELGRNKEPRAPESLVPGGGPPELRRSRER
jgi:hypothetical protein